MAQDIDKKSVVAVALLGLGMIFVANPVYTPTGGAGGGTVEASPVELNLSQPSGQELTQFSRISRQSEKLPDLFYNIKITPFVALSGQEREAFLTGLDGIYTGGGNASRVVSYNGSVYRGTLRQTEVGEGLVYDEFSDNVTFFISKDTLNGTLADSFERAVEGESVEFDRRSIILSGYDYVVDDGLYAVETSRNSTNPNKTVLTVSQTSATEALGPIFTPVEEIEPSELRESLLDSFEEPQVLSPEFSDSARQGYQFVRREGTLYQMRYEQASVPITEALTLFNFAGMAFGVLLILGGMYMIREVYREQTKKYRIS